METISTDSAQAAQRAAQALQAGGVVLFPTDTLYGLGADALSNEAVDKIYAIKRRDEGKPIHALVRDLEMAERFAEVNDDARLALERLPRGKVTIICKKKIGIDTGICRGIDTIGFRIPDNAFCLALLDAFGGPITATSANVAGMQPQRSIDAILAQFEHSHIPQNVGMIDVVVDGGELPASAPSTVVSFVDPHPVILREGAVPAADVWSALLVQDSDQG